MKFVKTILGAGIVAVSIAACCSCDSSELPHADAGKPENAVVDRTAFAKGADISWVTQMESQGMKFYNSEGVEKECTALMKEIGMNAVRYRVWVNPVDGWNSATDVLVKALRAQKLGMRIMIDFHYSDTWADPGNQNPPVSWTSYDIGQLTKALADHTTEALSLFKKYGIEVEWVQVGNETRTGMMWPLGSYKENGGKNYTTLTNAGYDAVKSVYPEAKVIVHLDGGHDISLYTRIFSVLKANGGKYDMIGMSLYPCWWNDEKGAFDTDWRPNTDACITNIKKVYETYGKEVMICETGMPVDNPDNAKEMLGYLLEKTKALDCCKGVFYWEPQAPNGYNDGYGLGAFKDGRPTVALDPFKN
ncbi:MAG: glycosyl hydrolase 53 family protein [Bacteroidales bacterium]|nr:glycosyl hydrolase 53 family protein [Bacteroidales bacterium]